MEKRNTIKIFLISFVFLAAIAVGCRKTVDENCPRSAFLFSADITLTSEEIRADSILHFMGQELLNSPGRSWLFSTGNGWNSSGWLLTAHRFRVTEPLIMILGR